ncbi:MAG: ribosome maturation factor RimM [Bacteroidales bacterium]|nr:ribosome maturation factor RimM [Bacteroidales bacterium]
MILKDEVFPIGQVVKPHGVNGEMLFNFTSDVFDTENIEFLIIEIQGIFVPFFIEEYRFKSESTGLIKFEGVESDEQARVFSGLMLFVQKKYLDKVEDAEIESDYFVGFHVVDEIKGELGLITEVDQTTENTLFVIDNGSNDELLIPIGDDYILEIDHEIKRILVRLPEGLLEL